ncbi:MAG: BatA domain-containing protein [Acidobacteriota bacterium]
MSFLAPLFLAGLALLALPVLVHLIQRERKNVVQFPSLMFVRRIPYSSIRRRRIHNWSLLALRLAALALIVAAFARPFVRGDTLTAAGGGARDLVVLLDRSYSMGHAGQWTRAQQAALDAVGALADGDRATLVLFSAGADVVVPGTHDRGQLRAEIDRAQPSAGTTRYGPALKLAGSLLAASSFPRREVVLISDFQRLGWAPGDGVRLPAGTTLEPVVVGPGEARNLSATPITVQREQVAGQTRVTVTAGVLNRSADVITGATLTLELDGHVVQSTQVNVSPHGSASATFPPVVLTSPNTRGTVKIADDSLERDNAFHFVLSPPRPIAVHLIDRGRGSRDAGLYLSRALEIGDTPRFEVSRGELTALTDEILARSRLLILNDVSPSAPEASRLQRFVDNGGGLLVALGPQGSWAAGAETWIPATVTATVDRSRGSAAATMGGLAYGHTIFEPFRAPHSGDFSAARFYGYRAVAVAKDAQVLARFDDGSPAVVARAVGRGRVIVFASTLDLSWNDLALKPVYLPFVHQLARHLVDYRERASWTTVGQIVDLLQDGEPDRPRVTLTPAGARVPVQGDQGRLLELTEQGFYEVRDRERAAQAGMVLASNVELAESDQTSMDPADIVTAVVGGPGGSSSAAPLVVPDEAQERAQRLWWYLLFAGILLLIGESVLAHRLSRSRE